MGMKKKEILVSLILAVLLTLLSALPQRETMVWDNFEKRTGGIVKGFGFPLVWGYWGISAGLSYNIRFQILPLVLDFLFWFLIIFALWQVVKWVKGKYGKSN